jgi:outer membrane protein assembly factor BamA
MKNLKPIGIPHSIFLENIFAKTYDATKLEEDTERVRAEFQNRGYFKVLVDDPKTEIHDTGHAGFHIPGLQSGLGKAVDITMPIEEGDRYRLGTITFKNNKAISNSRRPAQPFPHERRRHLQPRKSRQGPREPAQSLWRSRLHQLHFRSRHQVRRRKKDRES